MRYDAAIPTFCSSNVRKKVISCYLSPGVSRQLLPTSNYIMCRQIEIDRPDFFPIDCPILKWFDNVEPSFWFANLAYAMSKRWGVLLERPSLQLTDHMVTLVFRIFMQSQLLCANPLRSTSRNQVLCGSCARQHDLVGTFILLRLEWRVNLATESLWKKFFGARGGLLSKSQLSDPALEMKDYKWLDGQKVRIWHNIIVREEGNWLLEAGNLVSGTW